MFDHVEAFQRPGSVPEALRLFQTGSGGARFLAGGTDLINQADRSIRRLIDLSQLGLSYVRKQDGEWLIGATTTLSELESASSLRTLAGGLLLHASCASGPVQTRNIATVAGRIASISQFNEISTALLALDAEVSLAHLRRRLRVPLADLFLDSGKVLLAGSLALKIAIPAPPGGAHCGWAFQKFGRTEDDISLINVAAGLQVDKRGLCKWARIAIGAGGRTPWRAALAEELMAGKKLDAALIDVASQVALESAEFTSSVRGSAEYLQEMAGVMVRRALLACAAQVGCAL